MILCDGTSPVPLRRRPRCLRISRLRLVWKAAPFLIVFLIQYTIEPPLLSIGKHQSFKKRRALWKIEKEKRAGSAFLVFCRGAPPRRRSALPFFVPRHLLSALPRCFAASPLPSPCAALLRSPRAFRHGVSPRRTAAPLARMSLLPRCRLSGSEAEKRPRRKNCIFLNKMKVMFCLHRKKKQMRRNRP